ncbi:MAG TPA: response regulator [Parafilimonas sp.]|jgi:CheY-like chemotaxis protein|nr:response regulator [Parafilimonas sp.]
MPNPSIDILVADDDEEDLELIETAITDIEPAADLHKVTNGKAVLEYLYNQPDHKLPCLIVLDYNMPELNGSEVLALMGRDKKYENITKVILSTSGNPAYIQNCLNNGASEYFVKPNNMGDFVKVAKKMIDYCNAGKS